MKALKFSLAVRKKKNSKNKDLLKDEIVSPGI
jgi:hypothetical protein